MFELNRLEAEEARRQIGFPLTLILDNIRSGHNVGSIFRTADALNVRQLYLCGITPPPPAREVLKTSIGAEKAVRWEKLELSQIRNKLGSTTQIIVLEQIHGSIPLNEFEADNEKPIALVVGNEVEGISDYWLEQKVTAVEIPQYGHKHSLNVTVATGIACWHIIRSIYT